MSYHITFKIQAVNCALIKQSPTAISVATHDMMQQKWLWGDFILSSIKSFHSQRDIFYFPGNIILCPSDKFCYFRFIFNKSAHLPVRPFLARIPFPI